LCEIADYLKSITQNAKAFRPNPGVLNVSARIGGDEFIKIVPGIRTEEEAEDVAKNILEHFDPNMTDRFVEKYDVGLSIGGAVFPLHSKNYHVLIKYADISMYHSKKNGKHNFCVYREEMSMLDAGDKNSRRQNRK
jgi:diguanylate cyclase (GGDEF)-like protein